MMPLTEIHRLARTVDDARHSPVADMVAAAWGYPPRAATLCRSSACHVFVVLADRVYLRFVPAVHRRRAEVDEVARLMRTLGERGLAVVRPIPAGSGALVETVGTPIGQVHAMAVTAAPGEQIEVDALTTTRAAAWGAALARLHRDGGTAGGQLPGPFAELPRVAELFHDDPPLVAAAATIMGRLESLPRDPDRFGTVHGDFELDNLGWDGDAAVAYDFDEAAHSWFVADIAAATRDLDSVPLGDFLTGYRRIRPLPEPDLAHLPLFAAAYAACSAVRARSVIDPGRPDDPPWLDRLRHKIEEHICRQRNLAVHEAADQTR